MIHPFLFSGTSPVRYGRDLLLEIPAEVRKFGTTLLLITGGSSLERSGNLQKVQSACEQEGLTLFHEVETHEPSPASIDAIAKKYRDQHVDCVVSIGGGSVLDCAKAVAAMLPIEGSVKEYLEGVGTKAPTGETVPHIAVPTTSGTGSEATKNAVISEIGTDGFKRSLRHDNYTPDLVLLDPSLMVTCPAHVTAACGLDAFTQLLESYVSTKASPLTDALALHGLELLSANLEDACGVKATDVDTRGAVAIAAYFSGVTLANAGLGVLHGLASAVGAFTTIPHGVVCGTLLAPSVEITLRELEKIESPDATFAIKKYAAAGRLFYPNIQSDREAADALVKKLYELKSSLNIKGLAEYGITEKDCTHIVKSGGNKNNPAPLTNEQMVELLVKGI